MNWYQLVYLIFGSIIVVLAIVIGTSHFISTTAQTEVEAQLAREEITRISTARLIEACLEEEGLITEAALNALGGRSVCDACRDKFPQLCELDVKARVENLNTNREWKTREFKEAVYEMWINIARGDNIDLGKLYVDV